LSAFHLQYNQADCIHEFSTGKRFYDLSWQ
jgi:hypothetical protein